MRKINSKITSGYNEGIMGAKTVKSLVVEEKNFREFAFVTEEMRSASIKAARLNAIYIPLEFSLELWQLPVYWSVAALWF